MFKIISTKKYDTLRDDIEFYKKRSQQYMKKCMDIEGERIQYVNLLTQANKDNAKMTIYLGKLVKRIEYQESKYCDLSKRDVDGSLLLRWKREIKKNFFSEED